ncbi:MAG: trimethylamine methyltransferase family protein [Anaerolineales bacterium]|nr:trimethylamine methyltransferase family protein [Anaerolineales bacterium]
MGGNRLLLEILPEESLELIEETALRLLAEVGIALDHTRATEMLHGIGCQVGCQSGGDQRIFIPRDVVYWALGRITPGHKVSRRDGSDGFTLGDGQVRFHNGGGQPFAFDLNTGKKRPATLRDVAESTRLLDALPNVDEITPLFGPQDVPPEMLMIESTAAMLRSTNKPVSAAAIDKPEDVSYVVEMAEACCGGKEAFAKRPNISISVSPVSPLRFTTDVAGAIIAVAESGATFHSLPAPSLGATGPVTMAGALALQHAEVLASFVLAAAVRAGAPVVYCSRISPIDLRTAISVWGGPEVGMSGAGAAQLAHRLGLPCDSYGLACNSPGIDAQLAYERLSNALVPALAGVDILSGVGNASGLIAGYEIAVLDDELIGLIKHIVAGYAVNDQTLAFDVMKDVILRDGVFLGEMHTVVHARKGALWIPRLSVRETGEMVEDVVTRARTRAKEILSRHEVEPLSEDASRQMDEILTRARRNLVNE